MPALYPGPTTFPGSTTFPGGDNPPWFQSTAVANGFEWLKLNDATVVLTQMGWGIVIPLS